MIVHRGGCHCGRVRFEVEGPEDIEVSACNCSICGRSGYLHFIVPRTRFRVVEGEAELTSYRFNTRTANHLFCRTCGVKAFYVPRSHPEGVSVNARCIDGATVRTLRVQPFDGANWERNAGDLRPLSS
jgi:hypothetical protein